MDFFLTTKYLFTSIYYLPKQGVDILGQSSTEGKVKTVKPKSLPRFFSSEIFPLVQQRKKKRQIT